MNTVGRGWQAARGFLLVLLCICVVSAQYTPPCTKSNLCQMPMECYTCTDAEYEVPSRSHVSPGPAQGAQLITVAQVFDNGVGGYPASAQCSATMQGCLYCWKQTHVLSLADGWSSEFQFKSCVPWPKANTCSGDIAACGAEYAMYSVDYCNSIVQEKQPEACSDGGWCTKTTTECACSTPLCNLAARAAAHNLVTAMLGSLALAMALRKCVA